MSLSSFEGSLVENIERFKDLIMRYNEEIESKRKLVEHRILNSVKIYRLAENGRKWYLKALNGKRVVGVDGSQISPLKELGIPIGVIQVAKIWVIHGKGEYDKRYRTTFVRLEENIELRRFQLEIEMLIEEMDGKSWLFFDGSLVPYTTDKAIREAYMKTVERLIAESERTETPVIAYIDKSFSRELAGMFELDIYDTYLLADIMDDVLTYTQPFYSHQLGDKICFSYIMVNPAMPVRIEYPAWMKDMHDEVVRTVIAECLLGKTRGYPYILERAHHYSCIDAKARASFMKVIKSQGVSFKWISKIR